MKKWLTALLTALLLCMAHAALADTAEVITDEVKFKVSSTKFKVTQMTDKKYTSYLKTNSVMNPSVTLTAPEDKLIGSIYVCFADLPASWEVQVSEDGKTWTTAVPGPQYLHAYVELPQPSRYVRAIVTTDKKYVLYINEFFVLGEGEKPDWVQDWQPTHEKAEILFISTHPDDELIFFGGAIPTYASEMQRDVVVAYFTPSNGTRSSELLNSLWYLGVRNYPIIGDFSDKMSKNMAAAYKYAGGEKVVNEWFVELYRRCKPEVVVTQDLEGEYGHSMHQMVSDAAGNAIALAANAEEYPDSAALYGTWEVKKFYRHLWAENQITFDWTVPLTSLGGATGMELADSAFEIFHKTQETSGNSVMEDGVEYDNRLFGLVYSTVGEDVEKNDFLENIDLEEKPALQPEAPAWEALMPELNAKGFLDEGEFIYSSEKDGLWIFADETCRIIIERKQDLSQPMTWFEAHIYTDVEAGEMPRAIWNDDQKKTKVRVFADETARKHGVVFATNTDYFTYRVDVNASGRATGVVIRDGNILHDDPYPEKKATNPRYFPNLDMMAFMEDGRLEVWRSHEITAKELLEKGAYDVYSFGPNLVQDGQITTQAYGTDEENGQAKNPRCALGMVEPGHYVYILVEGRMSKTRSQGITIVELAKLMRASGCENAINLDGGQTAVLVFMGKQLNQIGEYDGGKTEPRKTCEIMGVGYSEQVGTYEVK